MQESQSEVARVVPVTAGELIILPEIYDGALDQGTAPSLSAQVSASVGALRVALASVDAQLRHLVKLVVHYRQRDCAESTLLAEINAALGVGVKVVITLVPLTTLARRGQKLQISAIAMSNLQRQHCTLDWLGDPGPSACHGLRCGAFTFTHGQSASSAQQAVLFRGDLVSQNRYTLDSLNTILEELGASRATIVKANSWRADAPSEAAYLQAAHDRFEYFAAARPAVTGITIPGLAPLGYLNRLDVWAMDGELSRTRYSPAAHWGWKIDTTYSHGLRVGDWLFVGGQAALTSKCEVSAPGDLPKQLDLTVAFINQVLSAADSDVSQLVKLDSYYCADTHAQLPAQIRDALGQRAAPAYSHVPVEHLAYPRQVIELEALCYQASAPQEKPYVDT